MSLEGSHENFTQKCHAAYFLQKYFSQESIVNEISLECSEENFIQKCFAE